MKLQRFERLHIAGVFIDVSLLSLLVRGAYTHRAVVIDKGQDGRELTEKGNVLVSSEIG